jgi:hypothetical protein
MLKIGDKKQVEELMRAADGSVAFVESPLFEKLIVMRRSEPRSFAGMSGSTVMALGYYEAAKRKAAMLKEAAAT